MNADEDEGPRYRGGRPARGQDRSSKLSLQSLFMIVALGLLIFFLTQFSSQVVREGEQAVVDTVIGQVRRALLADVSRRQVQQEMRTLPELAGANPFELYGALGTQYAGAISEHASRPASGTWYFDRRLRDLVYRVRDSASFRTDGPFRDEIHLHLALSFVDRDKNGRFDAAVDEPVGVNLEARYPYRWTD